MIDMAQTKNVHKVKAAAVVVKTGGTERYLYKGAVLPAGTAPEEIKRLVGIGLVEKATVRSAPKDEAPAQDSEGNGSPDDSAGGADADKSAKDPAGGSKK